ncbi:hypothetical protein HAX54_044724, partial [Datura stramonium]|nr:hypothetical protein [Datura stramonium]
AALVVGENFIWLGSCPTLLWRRISPKKKLKLKDKDNKDDLKVEDGDRKGKEESSR